MKCLSCQTLIIGLQMKLFEKNSKWSATWISTSTRQRRYNEIQLSDTLYIYITYYIEINRLFLCILCIIIFLQEPTEIQNFKYLCCWCCKSGPITGILRICRTGYVPGDSILFDFTIKNRSRRVCGVSVLFIKVCNIGSNETTKAYQDPYKEKKKKTEA